jgi:nucleotide-binding universal stress UspA family protein
MSWTGRLGSTPQQLSRALGYTFQSRISLSPTGGGIHRIFDDISSQDGSVLQFAQGDVGDVLVRLSANADLLVVGTREPVRGRAHLAGSVSHYCISYASCPVVTVPGLLPSSLHDLSGDRPGRRGRAAAAR